MKKLILISAFSLFSAASTISCQEERKKTEDVAVQSDTDFRPNFHFTPQENWMNDPNGMFYYNGYYHLFFQYYPEDNVWGPMHWGHAISTDMIEWRELPIALAPDENGYIFSGSAVVDVNNTSGLGDGTQPPIIAMFTYHDPQGEEEGEIDYQTQGIAYSLDEGKSWIKYEGNPVIANPGIKDFRDPKVQWDEVRQQWVMVLAADDKTMFYTSRNLKDWELASEWGQGVGAHGGVWECPDFFPMIVEGSDEIKWVLIQSLNPGGYNGGSGTQYFIGDFDGKEFTPIPEMQNLGPDHTYWIDFGKDNYAGVTWANIPANDGRKLFMGWMSNWQYAQEVPTETWRSAMTIARELKLKKKGNSYRIFSKPVEELQSYVQDVVKKDRLSVSGTTTLVGLDADTNLAKAYITFTIPELADKNYEFALLNKAGDTLKFGYNNRDKQFYVNRKDSGITDFSEAFAETISTAPRTSKAVALPVEIILDRTSIELFYDNGETVMTEIFFPTRPYEELMVTGDDSFIINNIKINQLKFN